jgi:catechol 2,3-dioxygenase-like lactoylglutathione lyase family enzyme
MSKAKIEGCRALHWVLKIGNLRRSLEFFENVLGLRVLRHEEFTSGCEATCNGPYGGAWSKTMIGYGSEVSNFALELTYNYGIDSYAFGNDLLFIALECPAALVRAKALGYTVIENESIIVGPDNYRFKILPSVKGRSEQFRCVGLRVANLQNAIDYWSKTLGLLVSDADGLQFPLNTPAFMVSFPGSNQVGILLVQSEPGVAVDHALSSGRIAFACPTSSVPFIFDLVTTAGERVQTPPLTLPTPGKADVVVTILLDRDGYEICFVEDAAFYDLATPLYDIVDFQGWSFLPFNLFRLTPNLLNYISSLSF